MSLLLLSSLAMAGGAHVGIAVGGAFSTGYDHSYAYTSYAPYGAVNIGWHFGPLETWLGGSTSALVAANNTVIYASAPLQGEVGLGIGSARTAVGIYWGIGLAGTEFGGYGRILMPDPDGQRAWGVEGRLFTADHYQDVGGALLVRADVGRFRKQHSHPTEQPPPPPVYHDDPYGH